MIVQWLVVHIIVLNSVNSYGLPNVVGSIPEVNPSNSVYWTHSVKENASSWTAFAPVTNSSTERTTVPSTLLSNTLMHRPTSSPLSLEKSRTSLNEIPPDVSWPISDDTFQGRGKKKNKMMMMTKMLMGLKIALLGVVLPLGVVAAKVLSWKAVTLSLLAFMLAKIVFAKNIVMGIKPTVSPTPSAPPPAALAPIIIHSPTPSHDSWKKSGQSRIHLQPEVHVHQSGENHPTPSWSWAEEGREAPDPHQLAFGTWLRKTK